MSSLELDKNKIRHSVRTLYSYIKKNPSEKVETVWLMVATINQILLTRNKPVLIPIRHPIQSVGTQRCLITKDPQQTYKDLLISQKVKGIHKVIGITKFRKNHSSKSAKKELMDQFDIFLADQRLKPILPKILGKEFYINRCEPMYIKINGTDIQKQVLSTIHSTYMNFKKGDCYAIKISTTEQTERQAYENIIESIKTIVAELPGGVDNLRSLHIKTSNSTSLPIYEQTNDNHYNDDNGEVDNDEDDE
ncbi:unnamed protein product [Cunninghamella blakesleeana]